MINTCPFCNGILRYIGSQDKGDPSRDSLWCGSNDHKFWFDEHEVGFRNDSIKIRYFPGPFENEPIESQGSFLLIITWDDRVYFSDVEINVELQSMEEFVEFCRSAQKGVMFL
jgi:hypothetical protein